MTCVCTQTESADLTIASGTQTSNSVSKAGQSLIGVIIPGSWAPGTAVKIQGFVGGVWCFLFNDIAASGDGNAQLPLNANGWYLTLDPEVTKRWPDTLRLRGNANVSQDTTARFLYAA